MTSSTPPERPFVGIVGAVRQAGALLLEEYNKPGGPRGYGGHCPADAEAEAVIRSWLKVHFPESTVIGEELHQQDCQGSDGLRWYVDPNDGTRSYLGGERGSAVSVGCFDAEGPLLGVVYAFNARPGAHAYTDEGDLFTWFRGEPLKRNGMPVNRPAWRERVGGLEPTILLLSMSYARRLGVAVRAAHPFKVQLCPSIAYRMARVAAGEASVTLSTAGPTSWDLAGGHALIASQGGAVVNLRGETLRYDGRRSHGSCTRVMAAGAPALVLDAMRGFV